MTIKPIIYTIGGLFLASNIYAVTNAIDNSVAPKDYPEVQTPHKKKFKNAQDLKTQTPIKHLVVIFQENNSFDRYFATYPHAANLPNEVKFTAKTDTPVVNGLTTQLINDNPNAVKPYRLTNDFQPCSQNHDYPAEVLAYNGGLMNRFVEHGSYQNEDYQKNCYGQVMGYYDGNSVTALWNYAQNFAMNDHTYTTTFGPSTVGALHLVAGTTGPAITPNKPDEDIINKNGYIIEDPNPVYDDCSYGSSKSGDKGTMVARLDDSVVNIGNLMTHKGITWGWFEAGFKPDSYNGVTALCNKTSSNVYKVEKPDYIPHHEPFQYFASTANPHHLAPTSTEMVGSTDQANHQYDVVDFWSAANNGKLPAISYLKAPGYQDGHGGYSNPRDEQKWLVDTINRLQKLPEWKSTAVIITYDDTDGDYDHMNPPKSQLTHTTGMVGYGTRIPFIVISPYAKVNYVDHTQLDQTSLIKFIEYNWVLPTLGGNSADQYAGSILGMFDFNNKAQTPQLFLQPETGTVQR